MPSISLPAAIAIGAGVGGITSLAGGALSASAAGSAAQTQADAETKAAQLMHDQYLQTRGDLLPYNTAGQGATTAIANMPDFNFNPTEAELEATPGYKFNLSQGLKSTQNSFAARGLGSSGAAEKGAAAYATGLADTTYQNQFANALNEYTTNLGRRQGLAQLGENAAAQTGAYGTTTAGNIGQTIVGAANASAAGQVGAANAISGGLSGIGNSATSLLYANRFLGAGGGAAPALYGSASGAAPSAYTSAFTGG